MDKNDRLLANIFLVSNWMILNVFFFFFTSKLKMDAKWLISSKTGSGRDTSAWLSAWVLVLWAWRMARNRGIPMFITVSKNLKIQPENLFLDDLY